MKIILYVVIIYTTVSASILLYIASLFPSVRVEKGEGVMAGGGLYIGSKVSKKFGYPWCNGPSRVSSKNRVFFTDLGDAYMLGYIPTKVCKGLNGEHYSGK